MKDEKGLTYVATIILVIIIIAFAIGVILYIQQQYRNEESETIKTNMLAIQGKAKMVAEEEKALKKRANWYKNINWTTRSKSKRFFEKSKHRNRRKQ